MSCILSVSPIDIATYMTVEIWNEKGVNWLRKAKSAGMTGFIVGDRLPIEANDKAKELGFRVVPIVVKFGDECDKYRTIAKETKKNQRCLFVNHDVVVNAGLDLDSLDTCVRCSRDENIDLFDMVSIIKNLNDRAEAVELIQDKIIRVHHGLLSMGRVLGTWDFWNGLSVFHDYLASKNYLYRKDLYQDLMFNLYVSLADSTSCELFDD